jgi:hypothetical protein
LNLDAFRFICAQQNKTNLLCTVANSMRNEFLEQTLRFHWFRFCQSVEIAASFDTMDAVSAAGMCALGRTAAQATLLYLFLVKNANVFEQHVWSEIFCLVLAL